MDVTTGMGIGMESRSGNMIGNRSEKIDENDSVNENKHGERTKN